MTKRQDQYGITVNKKDVFSGAALKRQLYNFAAIARNIGDPCRNIIRLATLLARPGAPGPGCGKKEYSMYHASAGTEPVN